MISIFLIINIFSYKIKSYYIIKSIGAVVIPIHYVVKWNVNVYWNNIQKFKIKILFQILFKVSLTQTYGVN